MMHLTLKQFRYFEALAQIGHFGRAAEASGISQPALSMQIKEMEESLGTELFERSAKHVQLTGFGEEIVVRVREILRSVEDLEELARSSRDALVGRLRMGIIPTIAPYLLPRIVARLSEEFSGLELQIRETLTQKLIEELSDGILDLAIVALPISEPSFEEVSLFEEDFVLVRHEDDQDKPVPHGSELAEQKLLLLEEGHCFRDQALSFCSVQPGLKRDGLDGSSLSTLVQMVGAGIGVTLIPDMAVPVEARSADVSIAEFNDPKPSRTIGMIWRKTNPLANQFTQIAEIIRTIHK
ncbi:MAG: hydrogen peroxide-inducible genes activator [Pseudomonadota bacterium]